MGKKKGSETRQRSKKNQKNNLTFNFSFKNISSDFISCFVFSSGILLCRLNISLEFLFFFLLQFSAIFCQLNIIFFIVSTVNESIVFIFWHIWLSSAGITSHVRLQDVFCTFWRLKRRVMDECFIVVITITEGYMCSLEIKN